MASRDPMDVEAALPDDVTKLNPEDYIKTPHNLRLYRENQKLKARYRDLHEYRLAHPKPAKITTREEIDAEKKVELDMEIKQKYIRAQLAVIKTLYRQSVMKVREEKDLTAKSRSHNDGLILGHNNLKYEEQSLKSEISAAENHDHKYKKLPLLPVETFLADFPEYKDANDHDLMTARIEHEHAVRVKLEERRQEKLKQKQKLIAEVKKGKDDLTKLDGMVEKFIEAAEPISKALATDWGSSSDEPVGNTEPPVEPEPEAASYKEPLSPGDQIRASSCNDAQLTPQTPTSTQLNQTLPSTPASVQDNPTPTTYPSLDGPFAAFSRQLVAQSGPKLAKAVERSFPACKYNPQIYTDVFAQFSSDLLAYIADKTFKYGSNDAESSGSSGTG